MIFKYHDGSPIQIGGPGWHSHKYGSPIAELLDCLYDRDEYTGDTDGPIDYCSIFGKRLLWCDSRGFVEVDTYRTADDARRIFDAVDHAYCVWSDEEFDGTEDEREAAISEAIAALDEVRWAINAEANA